jgi:hypothetical protein
VLAKEMTDGFERLWREGRLDLTVENLAWRHRSMFPPRLGAKEWWTTHNWISDRHVFRDGKPIWRPSYQPDDLLVLYVVGVSCPAIVRVTREAEFEPERVRDDPDYRPGDWNSLPRPVLRCSITCSAPDSCHSGLGRESGALSRKDLIPAISRELIKTFDVCRSCSYAAAALEHSGK